MPRGDGTGPMGMGSKTGRGLGFCTGFIKPRYMKYGKRQRRYKNMIYLIGLIPGCAYVISQIVNRYKNNN